MLNQLTSEKMADTFLKSKDGKGYILDIRRPSMKKNQEVYKQESEAKIELPTRIGLGNRVLRRVNFIKPAIQPRTVVEGRMRPKIKSVQEMIKEGLKIKYEEPDPWDVEWLEAKNAMILKMKATNATDAEIDLYLKKYPPLNRMQRTRPVNKNPFEDANKPLEEQLKKLGDSVTTVSKIVEKNTENANNISFKQLSQNTTMANWVSNEMSKIEAIVNQVNLDSDRGRDMLGAKLQQIVDQMTIQKAISSNILQASIEKLNLPIDYMDTVNYEELTKTPGMNLFIMSLFKPYNQNPDLPVFEFLNQQDVTTETITFHEGLQKMSQDSNIILINDHNNMQSKKIIFKDLGPGGRITSITEIPSRVTELKTLGFDTTSALEDEVEDEKDDPTLVPTPAPAPVPTPVPTPAPVSAPKDYENPEQRQKIIAELILIIKEALRTSAENDEKSSRYYNEWVSEFEQTGKKYPDFAKRILKININYSYENDEKTGKFVQTNPDFLNLKIHKVAQNSRAPFVKDKEVFDYTYNPVKDRNNVYFIWSSQFALSKGSPERYDEIKKYIADAVLPNILKLYSEQVYVPDAEESLVKADIYAQQADDARQRAEAATKTTEIISERAQDAAQEAQDLENLKIRRAEYKQKYQDYIDDIDTYLQTLPQEVLDQKLKAISKIKEEISDNMNDENKLSETDYLAIGRRVDRFTNVMRKQLQDYQTVNIKMPGSGYKKNNKSLLYKMKTKGGAKKENPWLKHVKEFKQKHPDMKYSDILKSAKATYKK